MSTGEFQFAKGNTAKLLALPKYLLGFLLSWFVPRRPEAWAFGSGIGVAEGALALALELLRSRPDAQISWIVADDAEAEQAAAHGFTPLLRGTRQGFWATLRARYVVVTHGLGDVDRFGIAGAVVVNLGHGVPLKRLHLDSPVTTSARGPAILRSLLRRMYLAGTRQIDLFVAASPVAAERIRSAYRLDPGRVVALGDPRDDALIEAARDPGALAASRDAVLAALELPDGADRAGWIGDPLVLYAPTWRDGDPDPGVPNEAELAELRRTLDRLGARLVLRSHPLGAGGYHEALGERVALLPAPRLRDITPHLGAFDAIVTDYSSIAIDFALLGRPIVWFAPDAERYAATRGLYEPLEVTTGGRVVRNWHEVLRRMEEVLPQGSRGRRIAALESQEIARRFHARPEGGAAARVLAEIVRLTLPDRELVPDDAIFFESFYGRQVACNPLAIDREIAARFPDAPRYWSVVDERQAVPDGARAVLVGGREWHAARRRARLLVVNDWLRHGFRRRRGQIVLQTWHGTMLKHLALTRPKVRLRTRIAIHRESRRWSLMLSQNPHSTAQFRASYAFKREILELGYPRDDRLAVGTLGQERNGIAIDTARRRLGLPRGARVLAYAPTWREGRAGVVDELDVAALADELGEEWVVVARGHTRTHGAGGYGAAVARVVDASRHPDVNDVILAADLLVTDYSSVMFDASVARVPQLFFVPDLESYRDRERGFTLDFEACAPGPLLRERAAVVACARDFAARGAEAAWVREHAPAAEAWRERFNPHDDGGASARVVDALVERGALGRAA